MSRFKIGQKVVCVDTHIDGDVIKGKIYTVKGKISCACQQVISIGTFDERGSMCFSCSTSLSNNELWFKESRFAPLEEDGSTEALTLEIEEFELETIELN